MKLTLNGSDRIAARPRLGWFYKMNVIVAAGVLMLTGVSYAASASELHPHTAKAKTPFIVGSIEDETGVNGSQGVVNNNAGIAAWLKVTNARGGLKGHKVKVDTCDAGSSITGAQTCATKMTGVGDVLLSVVPGEIAAALPVLLSEGKVAFTQTPIENPALGSNLFQVVPPLTTYVKAFLAPAAAQGIKVVGAIVTNDASGIGITKALNITAAALGMTVDIEQIPTGATTATVQVEQLMQEKVGVLFDGGVGSTGIGILSSIQSLGLTTIPVGVEAGNVANSFLDSARSSIPGQIYGPPSSLFSFPSLLTGRNATIAKAFEKKYFEVTHKHLNTNLVSVFGAGLVNSAAQLLLEVGAHPTLAVAESQLLGHTLNGIQTLKFLPTAPQDAVNIPIGLAEATSTSIGWRACVNGGPLHCPAS